MCDNSDNVLKYHFVLVTERTGRTDNITSKRNAKKKHNTSTYFKFIFSILVVAAVLFVIFIVVIIRYA